jgi:DNA modification methylase
MNHKVSHSTITEDHPTAAVFHGDAQSELAKLAPESVDLVISSPPYNIGKIYERDRRLSLDEYISWQTDIIALIANVTKPSGSVCWQVGNYIKDGILTPLDIPFHGIFQDHGFQLRNRIIWRFNFGLNSDRRFSGRYETLLWFTKTTSYKFNLDPVRVPQIYPGKRHSRAKGALAGRPSGNPKGKNPSDFWEFSAPKEFIDDPVWEIPNVKSNHVEKTAHPCQFPVELAERCVLAFTNENDIVLDPFVGTGSSLLAAIKHNRHGLGIDKDAQFVDIANQRIAALQAGTLRMRPAGLPVRRPRSTEQVSRIPKEWQSDCKQTQNEGG